MYWNIFTMHGPMNVKFANNTSKWQIEFNSEFKGLMYLFGFIINIHTTTFSYINHGQVTVSVPSLMPMPQGVLSLWILGFRILRVTAPNNTVWLGVLERNCKSCVVTPSCASEGLTRFEFLVVALLKIQVFWDVKLCRTINSGRRFEGMLFLLIQG
jgi:hypothetical protein